MKYWFYFIGFITAGLGYFLILAEPNQAGDTYSLVKAAIGIALFAAGLITVHLTQRLAEPPSEHDQQAGGNILAGMICLSILDAYGPPPKVKKD